MNKIIQVPKSFWIIASLALLWNAMGVAQYLGAAYMSDEVLASYTIEQQELYQSMPAWVTAAFASAVFAGFLGSLLLLFRKKIAGTLFIISLLAAIAQNVYGFFLSETLQVMGSSALIVPVLVISINVVMIWFCSNAARKEWIQ